MTGEVLVHAESYRAAHYLVTQAGLDPARLRLIRHPHDLQGRQGGTLYITRRATWSPTFWDLAQAALAAGLTISYPDSDA